MNSGTVAAFQAFPPFKRSERGRALSLVMQKRKEETNEDLHAQFPTSSFLNSTVLILPPPLSILFLLPSFATPLFLSSSSVPSATPPGRARKVGGKVFLGNKPFRHGFPFSTPLPSLRRRAISLLFREYFAVCTVLGKKDFLRHLVGALK